MNGNHQRFHDILRGFGNTVRVALQLPVKMGATEEENKNQKSKGSQRTCQRSHHTACCAVGRLLLRLGVGFSSSRKSLRY